MFDDKACLIFSNNLFNSFLKIALLVNLPWHRRQCLFRLKRFREIVSEIQTTAFSLQSLGTKWPRTSSNLSLLRSFKFEMLEFDKKNLIITLIIREIVKQLRNHSVGVCNVYVWLQDQLWETGTCSVIRWELFTVSREILNRALLWLPIPTLIHVHGKWPSHFSSWFLSQTQRATNPWKSLKSR